MSLSSSPFSSSVAPGRRVVLVYLEIKCFAFAAVEQLFKDDSIHELPCVWPSCNRTGDSRTFPSPFRDRLFATRSPRNAFGRQQIGGNRLPGQAKRENRSAGLPAVAAFSPANFAQQAGAEGQEKPGIHLDQPDRSSADGSQAKIRER